jgi:hypothetical protein
MLAKLVAHTGFEPVISALRGRRPKPLDECATGTHYYLASRKKDSAPGLYLCKNDRRHWTLSPLVNGKSNWLAGCNSGYATNTIGEQRNLSGIYVAVQFVKIV